MMFVYINNLGVHCALRQILYVYLCDQHSLAKLTKSGIQTCKKENNKQKMKLDTQARKKNNRNAEKKSSSMLL